MIDLPKNIKTTKTLKTFLKRLGEYCLYRADKDISVVRHFLQVYLEIARIRGDSLVMIWSEMDEVKYHSKEATYDAFYGMQRKFTSPEHRNFMCELFYAQMQGGIPQNVEVFFNSKIKDVAFHAVKSLFFLDPRGMYRNVEAQYMIDFASKSLLEYAGDINGDLVLIKSAVIMETDVHFIRGVM